MAEALVTDTLQQDPEAPYRLSIHENHRSIPSTFIPYLAVFSLRFFPFSFIDPPERFPKTCPRMMSIADKETK
jgi:hypothetical protein